MRRPATTNASARQADDGLLFATTQSWHIDIAAPRRAVARSVGQAQRRRPAATIYLRDYAGRPPHGFPGISRGSGGLGKGGDDAVDLIQRVAGELALGGFGLRVGFLEVAEDDDVLVVQRRRRGGVVEAAGDDEAFVDDHQLVVDLADTRPGAVLEQL